MKPTTGHDLASRVIENCTQPAFYGEVVLKFEAGKIVHIKRTESFLPYAGQRSNHDPKNGVQLNEPIRD